MLLVLAWYFAAVQLSMPSSAFSVVFLTEEREWENESCDFRSAQDHAPVGTVSLAHTELQSSYSLPNSTSKGRKAAGVPHIAWAVMYLSCCLLTFCNCCRDFQGARGGWNTVIFQKWTESFSDSTLFSDFFLWLDNKILLFLKMTPYESPPAAGLKFHTNCMKNNW